MKCKLQKQRLIILLNKDLNKVPLDDAILYFANIINTFALV